MRLRCLFDGRGLILASCLALGCIGCHEPNYRNEVTTDGEGKIEVHRVPKDASESAAPAPAPLPSSSVAPVVSPGDSIDKRIEALEAQVERLNEEITKLKLQKAAGTQGP